MKPNRILVHLAVSLVAGIFTGFLAWRWLLLTGSSDLILPLCSSRALVAGEDAYSACSLIYRGKPAATYPLTTLVILAPFSGYDWTVGSALVWGFMNCLLIYGILQNGKPLHFMLFTSAAYWYSFGWVQFSPLITAVLLMPALLPLALAKPQIGLPVILTNLSKRRILAVAVLIILTFIIYPKWPIAWFKSAKNFDGYIPLLLLPFGPLMLLSLFNLRNRDNAFLLLMACMPQRAIYDLTALWLLPKSLRQMLILSTLSWIGFAIVLYYHFTEPEDAGWLSLAFVYLPLLLIQFAPTLRKFFTGSLIIN